MTGHICSVEDGGSFERRIGAIGAYAAEKNDFEVTLFLNFHFSDFQFEPASEASLRAK